jgi:uncharacterized OB-fold protein
MDALSLLVSLALAAGAFGLVLYPLWRQTRPDAFLQTDHSGRTLEEYQARYQATLAAIKDLMFDYEMGKISAEDYERLLSKTKLEAAEIRHRLDRLSHSAAADVAATLDVEIERLVAQLRNTQPEDGDALWHEVEAEIEFLKNIQLDPAEVDEAACPNCGQAYLPGDSFCTGCGRPLPELAADDEMEAQPDVCPACGYAYQPDDAFCAHCGLALEAGQRVQPHEEVVTG